MIHYETTADAIFSCDPFLVISPYLIRRSNLLGPYVVELRPDVVWKITFEEQITGININRPQEVVNK